MKKNLVLIVYTALVLSIGVGFYFLNGYLSHKATVEQLLHREQIIARSGALSIEQFLNDFAISLMLHSEHGEISQSGLDDFISGWRDTPVEGIVYVNKNGETKINSNKIKTITENVSVSDRDYFKWALTSKQGEYHIGDPIISRHGNTKGRYVIPVTTAVFDTSSGFNGLLVVAIDLDAMIKKFSEPLKISNNTAIYLLDSKQNSVFSPYEEGNRVKILRSGVGSEKEGKFYSDLPERFLSAYSVVNLPGSDWVLIVTTPTTDADAFMGTIYNNHFFVLMFFVIVVLGYAILDVTKVWYTERLLYERGYKKGRN